MKSQGVTMSAVLPIKEASKNIGVGHTKMYELIREGKLDARKQGSRTVITVESIGLHIASLPRLQLSANLSRPQRRKNGA
ncbi:helix-turn-helix domain-containing protein [Reyranella soli]|uniref:Helix-turn-helix domain-containing protein n=1 Tax=Reyranella soli TaxID=1230389 RepID=A0A512NL33_9HYPH|nr:helix-turn-helix domain-containing protein [Reyranella soli]GEP59642.1 hypothetical protein RSO01_68080 [Reyranella soli]